MIGLELQQGKNLRSSLVEDDFFTGLGENLLHRLKIKPGTGDFRGLLILLKPGIETGNVPFRLIDALEGVTLGGLDFLLSHTTSYGNFLIVLSLSLVDHPLPFLLGLVDLIEGSLDGNGRIDVLQLDQVYAHSEVEFLNSILEKRTGALLDFLTPDGDYLINRTVTHHRPHDGFRNVAEGALGVEDLEKEFLGVIDPVLDDPLDLSRIEIARKHALLPVPDPAVGSLRGVGGARSGKPILLLELALDGQDVDVVDPEGQLEVQAGWTFSGWALPKRRTTPSDSAGTV